MLDKIISNVEKVIVGKTDEIKLVLVSFLCEGHVLIEDVPGVGKTMLAKSFAKTVGCTFSRIQFTPDMLPSDIIGVNIYNQDSHKFDFVPGPVHNQIILSDEINRATPKTQSALLECMEEHQVTVDGVTYPMPRPFLVIATQNPIEYEGTFPLPESQMDRFFLRVSLGYPSEEMEEKILAMQQYKHPIESVEKVVSVEEILEMQKKTREIFVEDSIREYVVKIAARTRTMENLYLGVSPRGSLSLLRAAQASALIDGRNFVLPDDVKKMALPVLSHRMIGKGDGYHPKEIDRVLIQILDEIPIPR